ncbi:peptidylprolyl isomerase [Paenibacillus sp. NFR01]|uniref:peptidylprolyl isomerase n=1 Tax=Paenibacillus sp. NFR01 TaxID=1566279 RepID=UPI0008CE3A1F|nr:peptidylprolyl isomerase [Paenibacillus sp. NFR01]SEU31456.1 foldase protein PrsA [Paenibacillus sp. NFR01]
MRLNRQKSWKVLLVSLAAAVSFSMLAGCGKSDNADSAKDTSKAVATYEGGTITEKEFDLDTRIMKFLTPQQAAYLEIDAFKESILKQEVAFEYLDGKASDEAKKEAEKETDAQMESLKSGLGDTYESSLKEQNLKEADVRAYMLRVLTVYKDMLLKITDDQVKTEFEATKGDYTKATVRHVLVGLTDKDGKERSDEDALKIAKEVKTKLDGGADFAAIVKEYSDDTGSVENGGEYKDTALGGYVEEFKKAAQTLPLNTISDPVKTVYGYHIMEVESRTERTFDQLTADEKETVKSTLASKNLESFMEKDMESLNVKIDLPASSPEASAAASAAPSASPAASEEPAATEAAK